MYYLWVDGGHNLCVQIFVKYQVNSVFVLLEGRPALLNYMK